MISKLESKLESIRGNVKPTLKKDQQKKQKQWQLLVHSQAANGQQVMVARVLCYGHHPPAAIKIKAAKVPKLFRPSQALKDALNGALVFRWGD
ncbi:MAG: hypothetical protein ORN29_10685 [Rhodoferax sp.]|nr:hypothetical protein [Rhodoferax sp.]